MASWWGFLYRRSVFIADLYFILFFHVSAISFPITLHQNYMKQQCWLNTTCKHIYNKFITPANMRYMFSSFPLTVYATYHLFY